MNRLSVPLALASFAVWLACSDIDTDELVENGLVESADDGGADYVSPDAFVPPRFVPPCPLRRADELGPPAGLPHGLLLGLPDQRQLLAQGRFEGIELWDLSDSVNPTRTSRGAVRGDIHQLLSAGATQLWVAATEPPALDQAQLSSVETLDAALRVVLLELSDPAAPLRTAEATLANDFWQMKQRGDILWVLTGRRVPDLRGCRTPKPGFFCSLRYEAIEVHGLQATGSALETVASAELPLGVRLWWATDGIASLTEDGTLHVLRWDAAGALRGPLELQPFGAPLDPEMYPGNGPLEIVSNQLLWVASAEGRTTFQRFDLDAEGTPATVSFDLGPSDVPRGAGAPHPAPKIRATSSGGTTSSCA